MLGGMRNTTHYPKRTIQRQPTSDRRYANRSRLPQILRMSTVVTITGVSRTTLWRRRLSGDFPAPIRLGGPNSRAIGWHRTDIEEWLANRPAA